jgi:hypothetical protein
METCIGYGVESHEADELSDEFLCGRCLLALWGDIAKHNPRPGGELRYGWRRGGFIGPLPAPEKVDT